MAMVVTTAVAQQPQNPLAPVVAVKAKYIQGSYDPTPGTGLVLNLGGGTANCTGTIVTYVASTLTMSASTTNYVYLNTSSSCIPAVKTTSFTASDIPIAVVVTNGTAIVPNTGITDVRASLQENAASGLASDSTARTALSGSANDATARTALSGSADDLTARSAASSAQSTANAAQPAIPNLTVDGQGNMTTTKYITASTIVTSGSTHGITFSAGTATAGASGNVVISSDATVGNLMVNENATGPSRACTALNGACASATPSVTSITINSGTAMGGSKGTGGYAQETTSAAKTSGDLASYDANGNVVDSGVHSPVFGMVTLVSGTYTVSTTAACTPNGTTCNIQLTRCIGNGSSAVGVPTVSTVVVGTSFIINSYSSVASVVTGDIASVCWRIN
jgi:hypothetical protein